MEKFTSLDGLAVHYGDWGSGERVLVLLHGYLESMAVWEDFAGMLAHAGYRAVALDLPGHGISEVVAESHSMEFLADVVAKLMDKLSIPRATVIGHSMGGYVALAFAELHPAKLEGLVLFHSAPGIDSSEKEEDRRREIEIVKAGRKELMISVFPAQRYAPENRKRMAEAIEADALQVMLTEDEGIVALINGMAERKGRDDVFQNLQAPELLIFGRHDGLIPLDRAEAVIARHPQAQVAWLEHSGHMGFLEEPAESLRIIQHFVPC